MKAPDVPVCSHYDRGACRAPGSVVAKRRQKRQKYGRHGLNMRLSGLAYL
jgi:hypothetical protein